MVGAQFSTECWKAAAPKSEIEGLDEAAALVGAVCEETMVACRNAEAGRADVEREEEDLERVHPEERDVEATPDDGDERGQH